MGKEIEELIAEAREHWVELNGFDSRAAEVLLELADALEAATRVPVQERAKLVAVRDILNRDDFGDDWEHDEWVYRQAAERKLADIEEALGSVMLAEPDAATAALDRVRAIHKFKHGEKARYAPGDEPGVAIPTHFEAYVICENCLTRWPCRTIEALDGAPEPEWEYHVGWRNQDGTIHTNADEFDSDEWGDGSFEEAKALYESEKSFGISNALVAKRCPAGPWLPVEGESK